MKKYLLLLFIGLFSIIYMPVGHALDMTGIPTSGVTYFLQYPDGSEEAVETYDAAKSAPEKYLFSGVTNGSGEVQFCDLGTTGRVRVVQHVPDGYTTNTTEISIDLSEGNVASFINYRGNNPVTSQNLFVLLGLLVVSSVTVFLITKKKKSVMIVPIVVAGILTYNVVAAPGCFTATVKDGKGNALKGVTVDVYGTPIAVDAAPAVKFVSGEGAFFDGTTSMYFRLPSNTCSVDDFLNSLSDNDSNYFHDNSFYATREDYYPDGFDYPDTLSNGTVVPLMWYADGDAELIRFIGNGGYYPFYQKRLTNIYVYTDRDPFDVVDDFRNDYYYMNGVDVTAACQNPKMLSQKKATFHGYTYYLCWTDNPDGIRVNNQYMFRGTVDDCYSTFSDMGTNYDSIYLFSQDDFATIVLPFEDNQYGVTKILTSTSGSLDTRGGTLVDGPKTVPIQTLQIIQNGNVILEITSNDLTLTSDDEGEYYMISNSAKAEQFTQYFNNLKVYCSEE